MQTHFQKKLFIGTSGWSYSNWKGILYPPGSKSADYLKVYSSHFSCAEVNSTFYNMPLVSTVEKWNANTPDDFRFCIKLYRGVTHFRKLKNSEDLLEAFFNRLAPLKKKMGPVLIQLPPSLSFDQKVCGDFFEMLIPYSNDYRFAIESRHAAWFCNSAWDLMAANNIIHVIGDSGGHFKSAEAYTSDSVYLRLHGRAQLYASNYSDEDLYEMAEKITEWLSNQLTVWCFFNNTMYGNAIQNAKTLNRMVSTINS